MGSCLYTVHDAIRLSMRREWRGSVSIGRRQWRLQGQELSLLFVPGSAALVPSSGPPRQLANFAHVCLLMVLVLLIAYCFLDVSLKRQDEAGVIM